jgi:hypothetical protein
VYNIHRKNLLLVASVAMMLFLTALEPQVGMTDEAPIVDAVGGGDPFDGGSRSTSANIEDLYTFVQGPGPILFGTSIANVGDVNGDGIDDIIVGTNDTDTEVNPPYFGRNCLLFGREDRDLRTEQFVNIWNMSAYWFARNGRWLGDVNDDGLDDFMSFGGGTGFSNPNWLTGAGLSVRLGSKDLDFLNRNEYLVIKPPGANWTSSQGYAGHCHPAGVGDINGDGLNDACVVFDPWLFYKDEETVPGVILLYYGRPDGIGKLPDLAVEIPYEEDWMWQRLGNILHGDVNGDGYSDLLISTFEPSNQSLVRIHYGSEDGVSRYPDRRIPTPVVTLPYNPSFYPFFRSPLDLNGDGFDDFITSTYDSGYPFWKGDEWIHVYLGDNGTGQMEESQNLTFKDERYKFMEVADINGDGLHDMVLFHPTSRNFTMDGEMVYGIDLGVSVHFNVGGSFPKEPDWEVTLEKLPIRRSNFNSDYGDFDGDGHDDLVLTQFRHSYDTEGNLLVIWGGAIMDKLTSVELEDGPVVYARYKAYDLVVRANPMGLPQLPSRLQLVLDPDGADVVLECAISSSQATFSEVRDPLDLVEVTSEPTDLEVDTANTDALVHFKVIFDWAWPHEDLCKAVVRFIPEGASEVRIPTPNLFRVENDLALQGTLRAEGEWQGSLEEGGWLRIGENVTFTGAKVVYEGTTDLHPPPGSCKVRTEDDDGTSNEVDISDYGTILTVLQADGTTDVDETIVLTLTDLPGTSTSTSELRFGIRVDGDAPTYVDPVPEGLDWHSSSNVMVSITAVDGNTSGADPFTLEYSYSTDGMDAFGEWTRDGLELSAHDGTVEGLVTLDLQEGDGNRVRWRVRDLVGNGPSELVQTIMVDTQNVSFTDPFPDPETWLRENRVEAGVNITDLEGSGIDVNTVEYRVSPRNLSQYGEWMDWDEGGIPDAETVQTRITLDLVGSGRNFVQWRAMDIAGNGLTTSPHFRIRVDMTSPTFEDFSPGPWDYQATTEVEVEVTVRDDVLGSGVDLSTVQYLYFPSGEPPGSETWMDGGMNGSHQRTRFSLVLSMTNGSEYVVRLRCQDVAGNGPVLSADHLVRIDLEPPTIDLISPSEEEKQPDGAITVWISMYDGLSGIDPSSVTCVFSPNGRILNGEEHLVEDLEADGPYLNGTITLDMVPGKDNVIQFTVRDAVGNEAVSEVFTIWMNRPPVAIISHPVDGSLVLDTEELEFNAANSTDPDGDSLDFEWLLEDVILGHNVVSQHQLPAGTHNIILVVRDEMGAEDRTTITVTVEEWIAPHTEEPIFNWVLMALILMVVVLLLIVAITIWIRRTREGP